MLSVENLEVVYEDVVLVLKGVSVTVPEGAIVALLGANGAGKTTVLRAFTGLLGMHRGAITRGAVHLDGEPIEHLGASETVGLGIAQVMEGRRVFVDFTVEENLKVGAHLNRSRMSANLERTYTTFPQLADRRRQLAGYLSGGEQQMLAIGRALMAEPRYLLLDEPSLGLAPRLVTQIRDLIVDINRGGTSILLVEQNAAMALEIADHGYVMENGKVVMDRDAATLAEDSDVKEFYLGMSQVGSSSRDIKHYKRRKRWLS